MTASRQLAFLTHKAHMCLASAESCQWSPSMIAVSLISLELEQFRSDWFPLTLSLLHFIQNLNYSELIGCKEAFSNHLLLSVQNTQQLTAQSCRQQKRVRHHTTSNSSKRKMVGPSPLEQDDIYASIKGLYGEISDDLADPAIVAAAIINED
ncbi:CCNI [Bugula neritina]|uniref:CCNI n=1 Tax=Bugula neritina TaxID=10212 RepID=A0A7J7JJQ3_BUGNE|nr:CCNI [Bugula neritina]